VARIRFSYSSFLQRSWSSEYNAGFTAAGVRVVAAVVDAAGIVVVVGTNVVVGDVVTDRVGWAEVVVVVGVTVAGWITGRPSNAVVALGCVAIGATGVGGEAMSLGLIGFDGGEDVDA
jgi:hypothetical protein